jgi:hypothetical protein
MGINQQVSRNKSFIRGIIQLSVISYQLSGLSFKLSGLGFQFSTNLGSFTGYWLLITDH